MLPDYYKEFQDDPCAPVSFDARGKILPWAATQIDRDTEIHVKCGRQKFYAYCTKHADWDACKYPCIPHKRDTLTWPKYSRKIENRKRRRG